MRWMKKALLFDEHTCPWWLAYTWDNRLRRWLHDTRVILKPYLSEGDHVADVGCGMGYFSIAMADCVGDSGRVFAVDLQQQMLDVLNRRARKHPAGPRIQTVLAGSENKYIRGPLDFILTFWMLHEVDRKDAFLRTWYSHLKEGGTYLLVEPRIHTSPKLFDEEVNLCRQIGFELADRPHVRVSRAALFKKPMR